MVDIHGVQFYLKNWLYGQIYIGVQFYLTNWLYDQIYIGVQFYLKNWLYGRYTWSTILFKELAIWQDIQ